VPKAIKDIDMNTPETRIWSIWLSASGGLLVFVSLFIVMDIWWHLTVLGLTLALVWWRSPAPLRTIGFVLLLVLLLAVLQILFSPFVRELFFTSLRHGFNPREWQYLLFAVERLAWPLVLVTSFQSRLGKPEVLADLTALLLPLKWLGLPVQKLQTLIILALRFIPELRAEWDRFTRFQTYFSSGRVTGRSGRRHRLKFWVGTLRAMIAHTIHRSLVVGDMLALRGLPAASVRSRLGGADVSFMLWLILGAVTLILSQHLTILWIGLSVWLGMVLLAAREGEPV